MNIHWMAGYSTLLFEDREEGEVRTTILDADPLSNDEAYTKTTV